MTEETKKPEVKRTRKAPSQKRNNLPPDEERGPGIAGNPNKYQSKPKIGTPTLGRSVNYVSKVGLGNLKVINADGYTDV